jgi:hypothetical protein
MLLSSTLSTNYPNPESNIDHCERRGRGFLESPTAASPNQKYIKSLELGLPTAVSGQPFKTLFEFGLLLLTNVDSHDGLLPWLQMNLEKLITKRDLMAWMKWKAIGLTTVIEPGAWSNVIIIFKI